MDDGPEEGEDGEDESEKVTINIVRDLRCFENDVK